ncbi:MAG: c-type cytochrome [Planctomycetes bacterium]|nr:c-type cytochrome [Planctomycetota bacterium]
MLRVSIPLVAAILIGGLLWLPSLAAEPEQAPKPPVGLPPVQWPEDNLYSAAKVELGRALYFDKRLSSDSTVSCASCHAPDKAFTDNAPVSTGIKGQKGGRSAPTVINRAYSTLQFWDGRAPTLEAQAVGPIANPIEMTNEKTADAAYAAVIKRLDGIPGYVQLFEKAFGSKEISVDRIGKAIATFERTVLSGNSPYDRYMLNPSDKSALNESQVRGMNVFFNKAACDSCHLGFNFTDGSYANIGIGMDKPNPDLGRFVVTKKEEDKGAFKTPTLREIEHSGPYMHDGSLKTLEEVVEHYDKGGIKNPQLDQRMKPLNLTRQDKADLVAFLKALSGQGWQQISAPAKFPE